MNRRSFFKSMLLGVVAPMVLPGAGRQWKLVESLYMPNYQKAFIDAFFFNKPFDLSMVGSWKELPLATTFRANANTVEVWKKLVDPAIEL